MGYSYPSAFTDSDDAYAVPNGTRGDELVTDADLDAGSNTLSSTAVPASTARRLTSVGFRYQGTITNVALQLRINGTNIERRANGTAKGLAFVDNQHIFIQTDIWMSATETVDLQISGATATDDAQLFIQYEDYAV